jgi:16S rRNA (adenine1518-N6/adenine1519-N6)-dimethyltransferase
MYVRPKKSFGQHFLKDQNIARKIVSSLQLTGYREVLEIGPGTGVLTQYLIENKGYITKIIEVDDESIKYLNSIFPDLSDRIFHEDFLRFDLNLYFKNPIAIIGNFPYNISSQILFKVLEHRDIVIEVVGMFQKEVAERIASKEGSKTYGILSVFMQAYYNIEYLFTVNENVFYPPPKVKSGVIRLTRNNKEKLDCDEILFRSIVKSAFNQRRKIMRNSLRSFLNVDIISNDIFLQRPEQLNVNEFVYLTNLIKG